MNKTLKGSVFALMASALWLSGAAQDKTWHLKDRQKDGTQGISLDRAYEQLKGKPSNTVIVAVIDSGIDTLHEDLKPVLWRNPKEIPGNGIDDDGNGYIDDVYGWNFIGGRDGRNVKEDSYESARVYHRYKTRFAKITDPSTLSSEDQELFRMWKRAEKDVTANTGDKMDLLLMRNAYRSLVAVDSTLRKEFGKDVFTAVEVERLSSAKDDVQKAKRRFLALVSTLGLDMERTNKETLSELGDYIAGEERKADAAFRAPKNYRGDIVKDDESDINDRYYGNADVMANTPFHGTHVAGIIAAARKNGKGIDGVADNVRIMALRAVPDGDEHDKDIALAIRYAVDNGARVINMSFGKGFSPEKHWVDDAVKYAESKGVLLVHAAGNSASDIDRHENYPNSILKVDGGRKASNWITVGASSDTRSGELVASFSNFGKDQVDVFAPGHNIYSTIPGGNTYGSASGTSMAAPVVAGVAALILSRYPQLTAQQVKEAIERSAQAPAGKVTNPATGEKLLLSDISKTGGVVNAYEAVRLAEEMSRKQPAPRKENNKVLPVRPV